MRWCFVSVARGARSRFRFGGATAEGATHAVARARPPLRVCPAPADGRRPATGRESRDSHGASVAGRARARAPVRPPGRVS